MSVPEWIEFNSLGDHRGQLVAIEIGAEQAIPFAVKRVYYIYHTEPHVSRGYHAHNNLKQVVICISGSCVMVLDDGIQRNRIKMDKPTRGLLIENMIWREMHQFSDDCVLLVLASEHYDENDYIKDYKIFKERLCHAKS